MKELTITVCMLTYNDEVSIDMALNSALSFADEVIVLDGGSTDKTKQIITQIAKEHDKKASVTLIDGPEVIPKAYEEQSKDKYGRILQNGHFGQMRQYLANQATKDWIFWLDADEAVSDNARKHLQELAGADTQNGKPDMIDIEYIHFVHDFFHIDNSEACHIGISRFHKNYKGEIVFKEYNHALPYGPFKCRMNRMGSGMFIFHLGYAKNLFDIHKRYKRNVLRSELHYGAHQMFWRDWHYFGYPRRKVGSEVLSIIPRAIRERFDMGHVANTQRGSRNEEAK